MNHSVTVVIPFAGADEHRLRNLSGTLLSLRRILPSCDLVVVEQVPSSNAFASVNKVDARHIVVNDNGPFNKSRLINRGVASSNADILLVCDADLILLESHLLRSIEAVNTQLEFVRPFSAIIELDPKQSNQYFTDGVLPNSAKDGESTNRSHFGEQLCLAGGVFVIRRKLFERVGGFDERFKGWGGEDDAFSIKIKAVSNKAVVLRNGLAWHLWHPRADISESENYLSNQKLVIETRRELRDGVFNDADNDIES